MEHTGEMDNELAQQPTTPEEASGAAREDAPEQKLAATSKGSSDDAARPTVIVMHASVGSGHRSAANAVAQALELLRDDPSLRDGVPCPEDLNVEVLDVLDFGRMRMNGDKMASMFTGPTRPIYDLTWRYTLTGRLL